MACRAATRKLSSEVAASFTGRAILREMDQEIIEKSGQEIRMFSSTYATATVGGFIAGAILVIPLRRKEVPLFDGMLSQPRNR